MLRPVLPQNYVLKAGTLIEGFENAADWSKGGPVSGTLTNDTTNVISGSKALRLTVNEAGQYISAARTISPSQQFTEETTLHLWIYIPEGDASPWIPYENINHIEILLTSYADWSKYFYVSDPIQDFPFVPGWNHRAWRAGNMSNAGGDNWARPIVGMCLRNYCQSGKTGYVTFDSFFHAQESMSRCVLTFDDAWDTVYSVAFAKMNPLGLRGTVYVTKNTILAGSGSLGATLTPDHINEMYEAGWAIANHSVSHPHLELMSQAQIEDELMGCYEWLVSNGWTRAARHVAYPYGNPISANMVAACMATGMLNGSPAGTGRTTFSNLDPTPVGNLYILRSYCLGHPVTLATVKGYIDKAMRNQVSVNFFGHSLKNGETAGTYWDVADFNGLIDYLIARRTRCVTIDEWYEGLTNPRYRALPV